MVKWLSVRMMLVLSIIENLHLKSIDFVLAYPQADLEIDIFMELLMGFNLADKNKVLKLKKNFSG